MNVPILTQKELNEALSSLEDRIVGRLLAGGQPQIDRKYLTKKEAAEILRVSTGTVYNAIKSGKLKAKKPMGRVLITYEDLEEYVDNFMR